MIKYLIGIIKLLISTPLQAGFFIIFQVKVSLTFRIKRDSFSPLIFAMIAENIKILEEKISRKCEVCERNRSEIKLIGVSKTQPIDLINEAISAGGLDFSDHSEVCWILGLQDIKDTEEFFNLYAQ